MGHLISRDDVAEALDYHKPGPPGTAVQFQPVWVGALKEKLGLPEMVKTEALRALLHRKHPATGELLRPRPGKHCAYSVAFSAGKTTSEMATVDLRLVVEFLQFVVTFIVANVEPRVAVNRGRPTEGGGSAWTRSLLGVVRLEISSRAAGFLLLHADILFLALTFDPARQKYFAPNFSRVQRDIVLLRQIFDNGWGRRQLELGYPVRSFVDGQCTGFEVAVPALLQRRKSQSKRTAEIRDRAAELLAERGATEPAMADAVSLRRWKKNVAKMRQRVAVVERPKKVPQADSLKAFAAALDPATREILEQAYQTALKEPPLPALSPAEKRAFGLEALAMAAGELNGPGPWAVSKAQLLVRALAIGREFPEVETLEAILDATPGASPTPALSLVAKDVWTTPQREAMFLPFGEMLGKRIGPPAPNGPEGGVDPATFVGAVGLKLNQSLRPDEDSKAHLRRWADILTSAQASGTLGLFGRTAWTNTLELASSDIPRVGLERDPADIARIARLRVVAVVVTDPVLNWPALANLGLYLRADARLVLLEEETPSEAREFAAVPSLLTHLSDRYGLPRVHIQPPRVAVREAHRALRMALATDHHWGTVERLAAEGRLIVAASGRARVECAVARVVAARHRDQTCTALLADRARVDKFNELAHRAIGTAGVTQYTTVRDAAPEIGRALLLGRLPAGELPELFIARRPLPGDIRRGAYLRRISAGAGDLAVEDLGTKKILLAGASVLPKLRPVEARVIELRPKDWVTPTMFANCRDAAGKYLAPGHPYEIASCDAKEVRFVRGAVLRVSDYPHGLPIDYAYARVLPAQAQEWPKIRLAELILAIVPDELRARGGFKLVAEAAKHAFGGVVLAAPDLPSLALGLGVELRPGTAPAAPVRAKPVPVPGATAPRRAPEPAPSPTMIFAPSPRPSMDVGYAAIA